MSIFAGLVVLAVAGMVFGFGAGGLAALWWRWWLRRRRVVDPAIEAEVERELEAVGWKKSGEV